MDDADAALLRAAAAGDREAYGRFARRHAAAVLRFCLLRLPDPHAAEDAAQEAMLRLFQQVRARRLPDEPLPWLLAIARRCCQEAGRAASRNGALPLPVAGVVEAPPADGPPDLRPALDTLNDFEAAVLHLKHTDGLRCQQIAARLGKPVGTVTAALSRAYAKLRAALRREVEA
jgi:DNA-directed RNA polymerase specialized sigma24 family protein